MTTLVLPTSATGPTSALTDADSNALAITLTDGGGTAISVASYGTDSFGDSPIGLYAETDIGTAVQAVALGGEGAVGYVVAIQGGSPGVGVAGSNGASGIELDQPAGVYGSSKDGYGVFGSSGTSDGVKGVSATAPGTAPSAFGVWASSSGTGVFARGNPAAYFEGDVQVTGDVLLINSPGSGDVAEDFDVEDDEDNVEPGTVLIIGDKGKLRASDEPYDSRVAGVVSGAGALRPAVVLQRIEAAARRLPVALVGKVYCKVDAAFGAIRPGDLLTTSPTRGHAMRITDRSRAFGSVVGKSLGSFADGRGLVPVLVSVR